VITILYAAVVASPTLALCGMVLAFATAGL
jgi:hypothetical protein